MTASTHRLYFGEWLDAYEGDDPCIADLQHDFRRSVRLRKNTPLDFKIPRTVFNDMRLWNACSEALEGLRHAAGEYAKEPNAFENNWSDLIPTN